MLKDMKVFN